MVTIVLEFIKEASPKYQIRNKQDNNWKTEIQNEDLNWNCMPSDSTSEIAKN